MKLFLRVLLANPGKVFEEPRSGIVYGWTDLTHWLVFEVFVEGLCYVICVRSTGAQKSSRLHLVSPSRAKLLDERFRLR